jgi:hypothetical protein
MPESGAVQSREKAKAERQSYPPDLASSKKELLPSTYWGAAVR